jgi:hypothetical protein
MTPGITARPPTPDQDVLTVGKLPHTGSVTVTVDPTRPAATILSHGAQSQTVERNPTPGPNDRHRTGHPGALFTNVPRCPNWGLLTDITPDGRLEQHLDQLVHHILHIDPANGSGMPR